MAVCEARRDFECGWSRNDSCCDDSCCSHFGNERSDFGHSDFDSGCRDYEHACSADYYSLTNEPAASAAVDDDTH